MILAPKSRRWAVPVAGLCILVIYLTDDSDRLLSLVTLAGHLTALHIGMLGWRNWLRHRRLAGTVRLTWPLTRRREADRDQARPIAALAGSTAP